MKWELWFVGTAALRQLHVHMPAAVPLPECQVNSLCWAGQEQQLSPRGLWWLRARWNDGELFAFFGKAFPVPVSLPRLRVFTLPEKQFHTQLLSDAELGGERQNPINSPCFTATGHVGGIEIMRSEPSSCPSCCSVLLHGWDLWICGICGFLPAAP